MSDIIKRKSQLARVIVNSRSTRLAREIWNQRAVTLLLVASTLFVIARTTLLSVPQLFPGGARIGEVFFELAIAYIGAWFFNLLVVILPRLRDRDAILDGVGRTVQRIGAIGLNMRRNLGLPADPENLDQDPESLKSSLKGILESLSLTADAPLMTPSGSGAGLGLRNATWLEWACANARDVESFHSSLVPYLQFLETDFIRLLNDVVFSQFVIMGRQFASMPKGSGYMGFLYSDSLPEFLISCEYLRLYYQRNLPLIPD